MKKYHGKITYTIDKAHLTTKEVETKLYDFFTEKMLHDELSNIDNVQTFKDYLATYDNGIVIDTADGTQIVLTIQTR